jgi:hypothetical protein
MIRILESRELSPLAVNRRIEIRRVEVKSMLLANDLHLLAGVVRQTQLVVATVIQGFSNRKHYVLATVRTFMDVHRIRIVRKAGSLKQIEGDAIAGVHTQLSKPLEKSPLWVFVGRIDTQLQSFANDRLRTVQVVQRSATVTAVVCSLRHKADCQVFATAGSSRPRAKVDQPRFSIRKRTFKTGPHAVTID